jgi:hypothetical protein
MAHGYMPIMCSKPEPTSSAKIATAAKRILEPTAVSQNLRFIECHHRVGTPMPRCRDVKGMKSSQRRARQQPGRPNQPVVEHEELQALGHMGDVPLLKEHPDG